MVVLFETSLSFRLRRRYSFNPWTFDVLDTSVYPAVIIDPNEVLRLLSALVMGPKRDASKFVEAVDSRVPRLGI